MSLWLLLSLVAGSTTPPPCTTCAKKPISCPLLDKLNQETGETLILFCDGTWSDAALKVALDEIDQWELTQKKLFVFTFNNNVSFRQGVIDNSTLVYGWKMYQTTNLAPLKIISPWKTSYPNVYLSLKDFEHNPQRDSFCLHFGTNAPALTKLNTQPTLIDIWKGVRSLKYPARSTDFLEWLEKVIGSTGNFPRLRDHIFIGHPSLPSNNNITGVHQQSAITYTGVGTPVAGSIQVIGAPTPIGSNGIYKQKVQIFNGTIWCTKSGNGGESTFFPVFSPTSKWSKERVLEEIAWALARVTVADWRNPIYSPVSNTYILPMTQGNDITLYIGTPVMTRPATVTGDLISAFPTQ